ncbi:uncharacterized protein Z520_06340 [Fonsecaea multimorphosa CBS 102226]|uniref:Biogenesis of lysosome-related organelles complex 1 subunit CNL1 n=1 Tax=Fonsecaea multimorphosa CBS 102226 TaxID=1442371 RepID=A0A0D2H8S2_9EURO|nr:uncharacterized protein Z520_06340 [Fonsecaea multimorphosa CBS 102226]KIX98260.1 hypothetical protein Z520_06340 [Fonsecaea multimorphosa CBS 102226]OAL22607.1 hypothetical protein AYO22_07165 [Fonsecaea multimorphosa]
MSAQSVADSVLGLTQSELFLLRQQQQILAQRSHQGGMPDRGRGTSRQSQPSSRAVSAASSQSVPGRIMLDPHSLQTLLAHLESVMRTIQRRIGELEDATEQSVSNSSNQARGTVQNADNEIARMRRIIAEIDKLEEDFEKTKRIRDKIKGIRNNVDELSDRLDRSRPSGHSSGGARPRR